MSDDDKDNILTNFFKKNPTCDPDNQNYVGKIEIDCTKDLANGGFCSIASSFGKENTSPSCTQSVTQSVQDAINGTVNDDGTTKTEGIKTCQSALYNSFVTTSISNLESSEQYLFSDLLSQQKNFETYLDLMSAEVDNELDLENLVSGTVFILSLVIIIYLLFSKTFL